jgi:catechol 2,3-dioxygenase-like lactoylglutathione lyase family enzyme
MVDIKGVAHFTIPVSNMERSRRFYTDIVGMKQPRWRTATWRFSTPAALASSW